jgi:urease accessory protein
MFDLTAHSIRKAGTWSGACTLCVLTYEDRFLRRKVVKTSDDNSILVDLAHTTSLEDGDAFELSDGRFVEIKAAKEPLLAIAGDLVQLAWHIGNRHTPCQIEVDRLLIQNDTVIGHMLEHLGATITLVHEPFTPEGGAYGHGRTHSHEHGHTAHDQ